MFHDHLVLSLPRLRISHVFPQDTSFLLVGLIFGDFIFLNVKIIFQSNFFLYEFHRRTVLGMTRFGRLKKSKESESFVFFLPRLIAEPGLVLNFSAAALRSSVVRVACLLVGDAPALGFLSYQSLATWRIPLQNQT